MCSMWRLTNSRATSATAFPAIPEEATDTLAFGVRGMRDRIPRSVQLSHSRKRLLAQALAYAACVTTRTHNGVLHFSRRCPVLRVKQTCSGVTSDFRVAALGLSHCKIECNIVVQCDESIQKAANGKNRPKLDIPFMVERGRISDRMRSRPLRGRFRGIYQ